MKSKELGEYIGAHWVLGRIFFQKSDCNLLLMSGLGEVHAEHSRVSELSQGKHTHRIQRRKTVQPTLLSFSHSRPQRVAERRSQEDSQQRCPLERAG